MFHNRAPLEKGPGLSPWRQVGSAGITPRTRSARARLPCLRAPRCFPAAAGEGPRAHTATAPRLRCADSAPLLRGQLREGAEELLPSRTLGGDSLGTED